MTMWHKLPHNHKNVVKIGPFIIIGRLYLDVKRIGIIE